MDVQAFLRTRPFAYHTTAHTNLAGIAQTGVLQSAARLFGAGDVRVRERRRANVQVSVGGRQVVIRGQGPLAEGHIEFDDGWDLARFVELLNGFVFFWPGSEGSPRPNGVRHFRQNASKGEQLAVLRVPTADLIAANGAPRFSQCNSGSPRMSGGRRCRRGAGTFVEAAEFSRRPGQVVELVFEDRVVLPPTARWSPALGEPWSPLIPS